MSRRSPKPALLALAFAAGLIGMQTPAAAGPDPSFYQNVPTNLNPYQCGTVLRVEENVPMDNSLFHGATATALMYVTQNDAGDKVAATELLFFPDEPSAGGDVLVWAHGTVGYADICAPSRYESLYEEGLAWNGRWAVYGQAVSRLREEGYVTIAPDYFGMGPEDGFQQYYVMKTAMVNAVVDGVVAARNYSTQVGSDFIVIGHSQGSAIASYVAEAGVDIPAPLSLKGVVPMAAFGDVIDAVEVTLADPATGGYPYLHYVDWGLYHWARDNNVSPPYQHSEFLGPDLLPQVDASLNACHEELFGEAYGSVAVTEGDIINPNFVANITAMGALGELTHSRDHGGTPQLFVYSSHDPISDTLPGYLAELCVAGDIVARDVRKFGHDQIVHSANIWNTSVFPWVADRFAGVPAPDDCAAILAE